MDEPVTSFPFNVVGAPMYVGSALSFAGDRRALGEAGRDGPHGTGVCGVLCGVQVGGSVYGGDICQEGPGQEAGEEVEVNGCRGLRGREKGTSSAEYLSHRARSAAFIAKSESPVRMAEACKGGGFLPEEFSGCLVRARVSGMCMGCPREMFVFG